MFIDPRLESVRVKRIYVTFFTLAADFAVRMGFDKQLVFLTESIFRKLESCRRNYRIKCANRIQMFSISHRRKTIPAISKYSAGNYNVRDTANKEITPVKLLLDHELRKSSNSDGDDDVFITDSVSAENNDLTEHATCARENGKEVKDLRAKENVNDVHLEDKNNFATKKLGVLGKLQHDFDSVQRKCMNLKDQLRDLRVNCTDNNNNSLRQCLWRAALKNSITNTGLAENYDNRRYPVYYDKERNLYTIKMNSHTLFYKNGILSRRRLAAVPIRLHTRPICLINSHVIPRSEQPRGLQDCL